MIVPLYAPFFALALAGLLFPLPRWVRRVDWVFTGFWVSYLVLVGFVVFEAAT